MVSTSRVINFKSLHNRPVLDTQTGKVLGHVSQIWLDKDQHQVLGFTFQSSRWSTSTRSVPWQEVDTVVEIGIWVTVAEDSLLIVQPTSAIDYRLGDVIYNQNGTQLGYIVDCRLDTKTGRIIDYLWRSQPGSALASKTYRVLATTLKAGRVWSIQEDEIEPYLEQPETNINSPSFSFNQEVLAFFMTTTHLKQMGPFG